LSDYNVLSKVVAKVLANEI